MQKQKPVRVEITNKVKIEEKKISWLSKHGTELATIATIITLVLIFVQSQISLNEFTLRTRPWVEISQPYPKLYNAAGNVLSDLLNEKSYVADDMHMAQFCLVNQLRNLGDLPAEVFYMRYEIADLNYVKESLIGAGTLFPNSPMTIKTPIFNMPISEAVRLGGGVLEAKVSIKYRIPGYANYYETTSYFECFSNKIGSDIYEGSCFLTDSKAS